MNDRRPTVSVCLPVYNGEKYVREAITSILEQTFEDFELIISDNASTDGTGAICRDAASRDGRVRYYLSEVNRGLAWNHNNAFALARGRYVAWIGHDDRMGSDYIRRCVEALERDAGAVLAFTGFNYIDAEGSVTKRPLAENPALSDRPSGRFLGIMYEKGCHPIYGVMRREILTQTRLHGGFAGSDRTLLVEMGMRGGFKLVPEPLFCRRQHAERNYFRYRGLRERTLIFDPTKAGKLFFPALLEPMALFSAIRRAQVPLTERLRCYRSLGGWLWSRHRLEVWEDWRERMVSTVKRHLSHDQVSRLKIAKSRISRPWF
jgi:hypothetical protein